VGFEARTLESVAMNAHFWRGKNVLVTGHTGFKGGWLSLWLQKLGASVVGYALPPAGPENLFELAAVAEQMQSVFADVRDLTSLRNSFRDARPDIVFHLAAQPLVRASYAEPVETFGVNVMGTVHFLEAVRSATFCRVAVIVTSDKCYENREWVWGYRESDPLGGRDPYSCSKGCAEFVTAAYRNSFFDGQGSRRVGIASARAGNVIGGGDFAKDRLVPDWISAVRNQRVLTIRNPNAVRPWQHVLEPLSGYLLLAERLWDDPELYAQAWNFGPASEDVQPVSSLVEKLSEFWEGKGRWELDGIPAPHEARLLTLDSSKARTVLGWKCHWSLEEALLAVVDWYKSYEAGEPLRQVVMRQIASYEARARGELP
jgi:CDP-glucose 4,6-dehydratase